MFKSLCDLCNSELKLYLASKNDKNSGEQLTRHSSRITRSRKEAKSSGEQLTRKSKPVKAKQKKISRTKNELKDSQDTEDLEAEIRDMERQLGKETDQVDQAASVVDNQATNTSSVAEMMALAQNETRSE